MAKRKKVTRKQEKARADFSKKSKKVSKLMKSGVSRKNAWKKVK